MSKSSYDEAYEEPFVPHVSMDPLNDPKSCTFKLKVKSLFVCV